jgi:hypothetical protein
MPIDKSSYFSVRERLDKDRYDYRETHGYSRFVNSVLNKLNQEKLSSAKELLERTALLLLNPALNTDGTPILADDPRQQLKNEETFRSCLPEPLRTLLDKELASDRSRAEVWEAFFAPANTPKFGCINAEPLNTNILWKKQKTYKGKTLEEMGVSRESRAYFRTFARAFHLPEDYESPDYSSPTFIKQFSYTIPGTQETLFLLKMGPAENLLSDYKGMYQKWQGDSAAEEAAQRFLDKNMELVILHPQVDEEFLKNLVLCLDPLLKVVDAEVPQKKGARASQKQKKVDAIITMYWLLTQSTPVQRGGTAYANVILYHLEYRLRSQGYRFRLPHTSAEIDLWAEAAFYELEAFKDRFKRSLKEDGLLFDHRATDEEVAQALAQKI